MSDLATQYIEVPVDGGLDTLTAPERVAPGKHSTHEDGSFREPGAVNARKPYEAYTATGRFADLSVTLSGFAALLTDGDALIGVSGASSGDDCGKAWAHDKGSNHWAVTDVAAAFPVTRRRDVYSMASVDVVQMERVTGWVCCYMRVYGGNPNEHRFFIVSEHDWTVRRDGYLPSMAVSGTVSTPAACQPRLMALSDRYFLLLWVDGTNLKACLYDTTTQYTDWTSETILATTHATDRAIDAWSVHTESSGYVVFNSATGITVARVTVTAGAPAVAASANFVGSTGNQGLAIAGDPSGAHLRLVIAYCDSVAGLNAFSITRPALAAVANGVIDAAQTTVRDIGILTYRLANTDVATIAYYDAAIDGSGFQVGAYTRFMRFNAGSGAVVGTPATEQVQGVYLYGKPRRIRGFDLFPCGRYQSLESTLYLFANQRWRPASPMTLQVAGATIPVARMLPFTADWRIDRNNIIATMVPGPDSDRLYLAGYELRSPADGRDAGGKIAIFEIDFRGDHTHRFSVLDGQQLMVAGSLPRVWERDLLAAGEIEKPRGFVGFVPMHSPVIDSLTAGAGGSLTVSSTYVYRFTFEYTSRRDQVCRSLPSATYSVVLGGAQNRVTIALNGTNYQGPSPGMNKSYGLKIVVWRTTGSAAVPIYYRLTTLDPSATTWVDDLSDANLEDNEVLYTSSGELDNVPAPPCLALFPWKQRIVALSSETYELWISKSIIPGELPGWNEALTVETNVWRSKPVYGCALDDKIIVWWPDAIGVVYGDPPSDTGVGGTMQPPTVIADGVGLVERRSIVATPIGLFFRAARGIYLLGRDLSLQFIGADVAGLVSQTSRPDAPDWDTTNYIVGACYVDSLDEVHFVLSSATVLVYHLLRQQWYAHKIGDVDDGGGGGA